MAMSKKFSCVVVEDGAGWAAEIRRRVNRQKSLVSKRQAGFASEAEAKAWAENELQSFFKTLGESNKRHGKKS